MKNKGEKKKKNDRIEYAFYPFCKVEIQGWKFFHGITGPAKNFPTLPERQLALL